MSADETAALVAAATPESETVAEEDTSRPALLGETPSEVFITLQKCYGYQTYFEVEGFAPGTLDEDRASAWAEANVPKFVYIHDYDMSGAQVELNQLRDRWDQVGRKNGSVAKIVKLEHAWRRLDGRNDDGFQVAPFPG